MQRKQVLLLGAWLAIVLGACAPASVELPAIPAVVDTGGTQPAVAIQAGDDPTLGELVCGRSRVVDGVYVWTDYAYDDHGADSAIGHRLMGPRGGIAYPDDPALANVADLIQLQLQRQAGFLAVTAVLQSLRDATVPVLGMGFDTDDDPSTGAPALPGSGWQQAGRLGLEVFLAVDASGAWVWRHRDGPVAGWRPAGRGAASMDTRRNTVSARVDESLFGVPPGRWRIYAALGPRGDRGSWLEGRGVVHDLAFVRDIPVHWQDEVQSQILAGRHPARSAGALVDFARLASGWEPAADADIEPSGVHSRLVRSTLDLGDGVARAGRPFPFLRLHTHVFLGRYQPYAVWTPPGVAALGSPRPAVVWLHGSTQSHLEGLRVFGGLDQRPPLGALARRATGPGSLRPDAIVVAPLGRGESHGYRGVGERDVLDVVDDAVDQLDLDPDRLVLAGGSLGGIGAIDVAIRSPDRWSSVVALQATRRPDDSGDTHRPLVNLRQLPVVATSGGRDPLSQGVERDADDLARAGVDHRVWRIETRDHELMPALVNCLFADSLRHRRVTIPARIHFSVPAEHRAAYGVELREAYEAWWLSGIHAVAAGSQVTAWRGGSTRERRIAIVQGRGSNIDRDADLCGPGSGVRTGDRWTWRGLRAAAPLHVSREPVLEIATNGIRAVDVDLRGAGFAADEPVELRVVTDDLLALRLKGREPGIRVRESSGRTHRAGADGTIALSLPAGTHRLSIPARSTSN